MGQVAEVDKGARVQVADLDKGSRANPAAPGERVPVRAPGAVDIAVRTTVASIVIRCAPEWSPPGGAHRVDSTQ
ncbi:hypothetical protein GCM10010274_65750 [Streptomyces lavendofoliae]|uniref:Uncharacterized protein n=1 Tax=Streptomyces lavendofoliae TaxID=67314 RepID=A0A918I3T1_9ACTN|nr:hypothetical protein GCM10010274_65750 [Streptomyces lavendofoliae]